MMMGCDMWSGHTPSPPVAAVVTLRPEAGLPLIQVTTVPYDEKDTGLVPYSKPWLWLCICPACQLPASRSAPSTQFRKGRRPAEKPFNPMEFSKSRARFRNWTLGASEGAGVWNAPGLPNITGRFYNVVLNAVQGGTGAAVPDGGYSVAAGAGVGGGSAGAFRIDASRSNAIYGASSTVMPPSVDIPVIFYLGRPK